jgi:hypothetical protein
MAGDSRAEIYRYGNINLAIKVGKQRLTQYLTLRNVTYASYFYTNLISIVKLHRVRVIINESINYLRYKDNGSLFSNLTEYRGLYLINAIATLLPTPTTYAISTRFFETLVYNKV